MGKVLTLTLAVEDDAEEIDLVLSHTRHEDRLADPRDIPQENLVSGGDGTRTCADGSGSTSNGKATRIYITQTKFIAS